MQNHNILSNHSQLSRNSGKIKISTEIKIPVVIYPLKIYSEKHTDAFSITLKTYTIYNNENHLTDSI